MTHQSNTDVNFYINGVLVSTYSGGAVPLGPSSLGGITNLFIGKSDFMTSGYLDGRIKDFRIYSRILTYVIFIRHRI